MGSRAAARPSMYTSMPVDGFSRDHMRSTGVGMVTGAAVGGAGVVAAADADAALSMACADVVVTGGPADGVSSGARISVSSANS
jgi:hypothetical protein